MALQDNAMLTVAEARGYLIVGDNEPPTAVLETLINEISDYCEGPDGAGHPLVAREYEDVRLPVPRALPGMVPRKLRPPCWPIDVEEAISVSIDGIGDQTVWKTEADGDQSTKDVIVRGEDDEPHIKSLFYRGAGWCGVSSSNPEPIRITYTGGFRMDSQGAGSLKRAARMILEFYWRLESKKLMEISSISSGPVSPGVSFLNPSRIPIGARDILNTYRHRA